MNYARSLLEACHLEDAPSADLASSVEAPRSAGATWAASGAMSLTGSADGPPRFAPGPLASAADGAARAFRWLAGDASFEAFDGPALLGERAAIAGLTRKGNRSAGGSARLLPVREGTIAANFPREDDWHLVPAWLDEEGLVDLVRDTTDAGRETAWKEVAALLSRREEAEVVERARLMGLAVAAAPRLSLAPSRTPRPFFELQGETESSTTTRRRLRVLDLSTLWAGPLATSLLAAAGLDVLKIEGPTRPDGARNGPVPFFDLMNGNKRGCALDLHAPSDRARFERLLDSADVVVESARPRSLAQLGYDAAGWTAARPGRIWTSITGYGRDNEWIAFGDDAAVAAGLAWSPIESESEPCFCADAVADPLTGLHVAVIILAHLRQNRGGLLDIALSDIAERAATGEHTGLVLPLKRSSEGEIGWSVLEGDQWIPVASPRGRMPSSPAPPLTPPSEQMLANWCAAPC